MFSYHIRTGEMMLTRTNIPLKGHKTIWESRKLHPKPLSYFFLIGCPCETIGEGSVSRKRARIIIRVPTKHNVPFTLVTVPDYRLTVIN